MMLRALPLVAIATVASVTAQSVRVVTLPAKDLIYDWRAATLYASVPSQAGARGNSLTPIDPLTGHQDRTVKVEDPYNLYFTPDGRYAIVVAERKKRLDFRDAQTLKMINPLPVPCRGIDHMDFTANVNCADPWSGQASPGANYATTGTNRARMKGTGAISGISPITADTEWYICKLNIGGAKTAGTGNCPGCLDGACFVLNDVFLTQPIGVGDFHISNALDRQSVTWQASGGSVPGGCPGATPTQNRTWGSVKSLYR